MQRDLVRKHILAGVMFSHDIATIVRYMRETCKSPMACEQRSSLVETSCLFWDKPKYRPTVKPILKADSARIINPFMGLSFGCSLAKKHILGVSLILSSRRYGERLYDAGLKARFQKGLCRLYTARWSRALSFATKSTYLLGRRIANLRPAFTGVWDERRYQ